MYHTMYSRVMEDQSRLLDSVPKSSSRATRKAKRALIKGVKEASRAGSRKMRLVARQRNTLALRYQPRRWGHSKVLRRFRPLQLKRKDAKLTWAALPNVNCDKV